jgi:2-keto-4-pentenoate hydratase
MTRITTAAELLAAHRLSRRPFPGFPDDLHPSDEDEAYAIQSHLHERLYAAGRGPLAGWKIGCTTPVMQEYLSIRNPSAGGIFADTVYRSGAELRHDDYLRVGVECELAVRLSRDFPAKGQRIDRAAARAAVGAVMAAIEIVEDRYVDYPVLDAPTLIADDFFGAGCVLGEECVGLEESDFAAISARMFLNERDVGSGRGADIMGDPLLVLEWLASRLLRSGRRLLTGQIVLLGSLVQTNWVAPGEVVRIENDQLGAVSARF